jgi:sorbitol/mannitol transport system substrate-binding protein
MTLRAALAIGALVTALPSLATELVIATVNNGHMITLQKLTRFFEKSHPDIQVTWVTLEEGVLRQRVSIDISTGAGEFDVMTIGLMETQIWGQKGWLKAIDTDAAYDAADLLPPIREGLSVKGRLLAAPFYGESSMTMARSDLLQAAGISLPESPTWEQVRTIAAKLHRPDKGVYGICLRGRPGWGENMALITPMVNTFGGQWFDMGWRPQLNTKAWKDAVGFYADLLDKYGPPGAVANGFNENLALFKAGKCGLWVDATIAASFLNDPRQSKVAGKVAYAQAPIARSPKGAHWLWAWALAIPASSHKVAAAQSFIQWATSKDYVQLVASQEGWGAVPTGTRQSTYARPEFMNANPYAQAELKAINSTNPKDSTVPRSPYVGVQFAAIPEFQSIGTAVGLQIGDVLGGGQSVEAALQAAQKAADQKMRAAGYYR